MPFLAPRLLPSLSLLLVACDDSSPNCTLMDRGRPQLDVFVRDAVTSAEICDATVELRVDGVDAPARLVISKDTSGACSYVTTGPTYTPARSAAIAVGRDGYESATTTVPPTPADECGYRRSAQATVALTLTK